MSIEHGCCRSWQRLSIHLHSLPWLLHCHWCRNVHQSHDIPRQLAIPPRNIGDGTHDSPYSPCHSPARYISGGRSDILPYATHSARQTAGDSASGTGDTAKCREGRLECHSFAVFKVLFWLLLVMSLLGEIGGDFVEHTLFAYIDKICTVNVNLSQYDKRHATRRCALIPHRRNCP